MADPQASAVSCSGAAGCETGLSSSASRSTRIRGQCGGMKVVLHRVDLRVRVIGTHFPYKTGVSNSMQRAVRKSTARFQDDGHRCRSTTRCRGNAGRIAEFWPRCLAPAAGHARRSEGFVRGDVQQQRVGRKSTAHFQDA